MRHSWSVIQREFGIERHQCKRCMLVRTKITKLGDYPKIRYRRGEQVVEGRAPECETKKGPVKDPLTAGLA